MRAATALLVLGAASLARAVTITCPVNVLVNSDPNQCAAIVTYPQPVVSGGGLIGCDPVTGASFPVGVTTVSCSAADPSPPIEFDFCSFDVRVNDLQAPLLTCPASVTVNAEPGLCGVPLNGMTFTVTDNCPDPMLAATPPIGSLVAVGISNVSATAVDDGDNMSSCVTSFTVRDTQPPTVTCPTAVDATLAVGRCRATPTYPDLPASSDNCAVASVQFAPAPTALLPAGATTVTATVKDPSNNAVTCEFPFTARFPNGVDCDDDRCTDEGCSTDGLCTFTERAPTVPDGVVCHLDNLRDRLATPPELGCKGKCLKRLERQLDRIGRLIADAPIDAPGKCRRRLAAMVRGANALDRIVRKLAASGKLDPADRAERATSETAALAEDGVVFADGYCP